VEASVGQTIPSSILFEARTIRELAQKLFALDIRSEPVTRMNPSGGLPPLFLFHGDYNGGGLYAARLAKLLGLDQPLFVIAPHDLGGEQVPRSIETIATDNLLLVRNAQPRGPYRLCGYCVGGAVAFEVARLLIAAGEKVEMVGMIDTPTVNARRSVQLLLSTMRSTLPIAGPIGDRVVRRIWFMCSHVDKPMNSLGTWLGDIFRWRTNERLSSLAAMSSYSSKPVAVQVVYFAAEYGSVAWGRISSGFEIIKIGGDHAEVVRDLANLGKIADRLRVRV
jgi:thioesterase domain-containing protein